MTFRNFHFNPIKENSMMNYNVDGRKLCFGRKPAVHNRRTLGQALVLARHLDKLAPAPAKSPGWRAKVKSPWGMDGNDQWGDCVEAAVAHALMLRTANSSSIVVPTTAQTLALYSAVTGFNPNAGPSGNNPTDQGTDETSMCQYMVNTGFL